MRTETEVAVREAQEKLARYYKEANQARLLRRVPLRSRLAQTLRGWAERLEPTPLSVDKPFIKRAH